MKTKRLEIGDAIAIKTENNGFLLLGELESVEIGVWGKVSLKLSQIKIGGMEGILDQSVVQVPSSNTGIIGGTGIIS